MATEVIWWVLAIVIVGTSIGVVASRSVIHSAIFLILSLTGVAGMYLLLTVEFIALVQFLIYGGAVTVLILLALMLTKLAESTELRATGLQAPLAALVSVMLLVILGITAVSTSWPGDVDDVPAEVAVTLISDRLFEDFGAPFVIASVLLLVALVGAIILARQEDQD